MPIPVAMYLGAMAAGVVSSIYSAGQQHKINEQTAELNQAALESNLEMLSLQSAQQSLRGMQELRQTIGSQIAMQAARGTAMAGSALVLGAQSVSRFYDDERVRRLNLLTRQTQMRATGVAQGFKTLESETRIGQSLSQQLFNNLPTSSDAWKQIGSELFGAQTPANPAGEV